MMTTVETENPLLMLVEHGPVVFKSSMDKEAFHRFLLRNGDFKIERDKNGNITIYPPLTYESSINEGEAFFALKLWSKQHPELGKVLSPSGAFDLPDGSTSKADGAWVSMEKHKRMSETERKKIAAIVPDFVMEVRSQTDRLGKLKKKMEETWIANGVKLAWLIDPIKEKAWIYRANGTSQEVNFTEKLSGEDVLPGFEFDLNEMKPE